MTFVMARSAVMDAKRRHAPPAQSCDKVAINAR